VKLKNSERRNEKLLLTSKLIGVCSESSGGSSTLNNRPFIFRKAGVGT